MDYQILPDFELLYQFEKGNGKGRGKTAVVERQHDGQGRTVCYRVGCMGGKYFTTLGEALACCVGLGFIHTGEMNGYLGRSRATNWGRDASGEDYAWTIDGSAD
jgi:hypothetical protein